MSGRSALFGFRFQGLRTVERLLQLYEEEPRGDWSIEIESTTDEAVDYAERRSDQITRAVQVKASMPESSTRLRQTDALKILSQLADAYPGAHEVTLESNRERAGTWDKFADNQLTGARLGPRHVLRIDERSIQSLTDDVVRALYDIRSTARVSADPATLRHVAYILEAIVFERGAQPFSGGHPVSHELGPSDIATVVEVAGKQLADLLGEAPWAQKWAVPSFVRIPRPEIFSKLKGLLPANSLQSPGVPARAAITGFSGAGKTSTVASWAEQNLETYAMILLLPASSDNALSDEVRQVLAAEYGNGVFKWEMEKVRARFLTLLEHTPLTWLLILDGTLSATTVNRWIPRRGFGHILITTRNSAWLPSSAPSFEITPMPSDTALKLVCQRLGRDQASLDPPEREGIRQLQIAAEGWPLALEMMLAWLTRTARSLGQAQDYFDRQRTTLFEREDLLPVGYPQTLVAAVLDALAAIHAEPGVNAWAVLLACSRLGSNSVPVQLVTRLLNSPESSVDDAVVELRQLSLIRREHLGGQVEGRWADRLFVNDIVSSLALQLADADDDADLRAINLLDEAVRDSIDGRNFHLATSLTPMAEAVVEGVRAQQRPMSFPGLALHGNMALLHEIRGDFERALELLRHEIAWGLSLARTDALPLEARTLAMKFVLQSLVQVCSVAQQGDQPAIAITAAREAVDLLEHAEAVVAADLWTDMGTRLIDLLETVRHNESVNQRDALVAKLREMGLQGDLTAAPRAERALRRGEPSEAERIARRALDAEEDPQGRLRLIGLLAEATAVSNYPQSIQFLNLAALTSEEIGTGPAAVAELAVNVAVSLWNHCIEVGPADVLAQRDRRGEEMRQVLAHLNGRIDAQFAAGNRARKQIAQALHSVLTASSSARVAVSEARKAAAGTQGLLAEDETESLQRGATWVEALHLRSDSTHVVDALMVARTGGQIVIAVDDEDLQAIAACSLSLTSLTVTTKLWFAALAVRSDPTQFSVWIDFSEIRTNPFDRIEGPAGVSLCPISNLDTRGAIEFDHLLPIGTANVSLEPAVQEFLVELGVWSSGARPPN